MRLGDCASVGHGSGFPRRPVAMTSVAGALAFDAPAHLAALLAAGGAVLGLAYCLGLGIPFVLVALGARWAMGATAFLRRHARTVTRVGGAVLVLVGVLLVTGAWTELMGWLRSWLAATGFTETSL